MFGAHVFVGTYNFPVPPGVIILAAVLVVAASFALIYIAAPTFAEEAATDGMPVWPWVVPALTLVGIAYIAFIVVIATFGRQQTGALNAASLLFWTLTIPLLPLAHCVVGGMYEVANPFAAIARLLSGGRRIARAESVIAQLGYWPAIVMLLMLVIAESLSEIANVPMILGLGVMVYAGIQVVMGILLGDGWYPGGDVFQTMTALASACSVMGLRRDGDGTVRFLRGFNPARFLPSMRGREALITLWLAGVLADGVRQTPIWKIVLVPRLQWIYDALGIINGFNAGRAAEVVGEILVTWAAFSAFFWIFVALSSHLWGSRDPDGDDGGRRHVAVVVSPSLIPIALAYLFAHNLTQMLAIGPLMITARDASVPQLASLVQDQTRNMSPAVIWWTQVGVIVLGHVVAVVMAHARLSRDFEGGRAAPHPGAAARNHGIPAGFAERWRSEPPLRADAGWLLAMLLYTATSLWVLALPITASAG